MKYTVIINLLLLFSFQCFAETPNDYRVKSEFVYNFISLTEISGNNNGVETLCYLGTNDIMRQNLYLLNGKTANGRKVIFYSLSAERENICEICNVIVADSTEALADDIPVKGVLVIGQDKNALINGAAIKLYNEGSRVRFDVSLSNANEAGLRISGKMLQHASEIYR